MSPRLATPRRTAHLTLALLFSAVGEVTFINGDLMCMATSKT